ncbi:hypothetical protein [Bacillus cereus group sp. N21]|uniref:hypothetical protein n=1 Tax=Bacillus cereus group sp. N21 TaxID=2794591 RepID=UPI0018F618B7|nr:hypothetical protein [Bacillus cereus group sp. N21]MBJ8032039.1 hypothetical protein [Bacillus cereus group sp. N21]
MSEYLTEEDYEIAKMNGIPRERAYHRFYHLYWDKERAVTEPVGLRVGTRGNGRVYGKWVSVAQSNGIHRNTFYGRVRAGMGYKMAATKPPGMQNKRQIS